MCGPYTVSDQTLAKTEFATVKLGFAPDGKSVALKICNKLALRKVKEYVSRPDGSGMMSVD